MTAGRGSAEIEQLCAFDNLRPQVDRQVWLFRDRQQHSHAVSL